MSYDPKIGRELLIKMKETGHIHTKRNVIKKKVSRKFRQTIFTTITDTKTKSKQEYNVAGA